MGLGLKENKEVRAQTVVQKSVINLLSTDVSRSVNVKDLQQTHGQYTSCMHVHCGWEKKTCGLVPSWMAMLPWRGRMAMDTFLQGFNVPHSKIREPELLFRTWSHPCSRFGFWIKWVSVYSNKRPGCSLWKHVPRDFTHELLMHWELSSSYEGFEVDVFAELLIGAIQSKRNVWTGP